MDVSDRSDSVILYPDDVLGCSGLSIHPNSVSVGVERPGGMGEAVAAILGMISSLLLVRVWQGWVLISYTMP